MLGALIFKNFVANRGGVSQLSQIYYPDRLTIISLYIGLTLPRLLGRARRCIQGEH